MVETKQRMWCSPFYLLLQEAWLRPPLPQTWVANVATTFSLRPHGSGLQHDVHTSGQVPWTAEQNEPRSYRSRQLYETTGVSRHLSRRQHTHEHTKREQLLFCVCPGAVLCAPVCAHRFNECRAHCVCILRALGSNERQEHGERGEPHFERHGFAQCNERTTRREVLLTYRRDVSRRVRSDCSKHL